MSIEIGIVENVEDEWAWVKARRKSACAGCGSKDHCRSMGSGQMLIKARNTARAEVGDEVEIFLNTRVKMKCLFLLYIAPVLGLMVGAFSAEFFSGVLGLGPVIGMVLFIVGGVMLSYGLVRIYANRLAARGLLSPSVKRVIRKALLSE